MPRLTLCIRNLIFPAVLRNFVFPSSLSFLIWKLLTMNPTAFVGTFVQLLKKKQDVCPCCNSSGYLLASRRCGPGHIMWDLWWTKWYCGRFSGSTAAPLPLIPSTAPHSSPSVILGYCNRPNGLSLTPPLKRKGTEWCKTATVAAQCNRG
jgi:hypothetical protein